MGDTARRVTFSALPAKQTNKEFLSSTHYQVTDGRTRQPPTGVTKETYSGTDGHFRSPAAQLPPKGQLFHADRQEKNFSWSGRATSARTAHPHPDGGRSRFQEPVAGTFKGVKGPATNFREHRDKQLVTPGYHTQNMRELPGRDPVAAHTPSAPTLMRDFMRHGDELNIPRPRSSYRDTLSSEGQAQTVHNAAGTFSGNLSFRRLRSQDPDPLPGLGEGDARRYRPSTASNHHGARGKSASISSNPLYSYRGHTSVPEGDRVKSAVAESRDQLFEDDYPEHSLHGHRPYNKPEAFDAVLGTNAKLGVKGTPIVDGPSSTRQDYPEKQPLG
ncbi:uncharacterized protein LOC135819108 [Sycon ciliatum]|uniref:uncharacterized protein LOC135819108 n=1 Tax=Sycon ciliatum TaxID=27933 RepID=UPI0031F623B7